MKQQWLNLLTGSVTVLVLGLLALPAVAVHASESRLPVLPVPHVRAFGVYIDPWHSDQWATAVGAQPTIAAKFEAFSRRRTTQHFTDEAHRRGFRKVLVSWEPWKPVASSLGVLRQSAPQWGYRNLDIANGVQDEYIKRFARSLAEFKGTVYLRYAHEMNGFWYPWSRDPNNYIRAWRHIVRVFRAEGAHNVRFVWSINPSLYETQRDWIVEVQRYWPGASYVDYLGSTMINFGGAKRYRVARFEPRLKLVHRFYRKPLLITESNTQYGGRVRWLVEFRAFLQRSPWIKGVAWSQLPSRGAAQMRRPGDLHWDVERDPASAWVLRRIIDDGLGNQQ